MNIDLFELRSPDDLFAEIQSAIGEYYDEPNSRLLLFLAFSLNHLREWIAGTSYENINLKIKSGISLNPSEEFYCNIWKLPEFRVVNSLCNRSKHHLITQSPKTSILTGMNCNGSCNDSLDQIYYLIDGVDSRYIFMTVMREYLEWFQKTS